jgi:hypothetical protein
MSEKPFTVKSFHDYLSEKRLMGTRCKECKAYAAPPRPLCPECGGKNIEWARLSGKGKLEAFTVIHVPPTALVDKAPYAVGIVKLKEGARITGRLVDVDAKKPEELRVGMKVEAAFVEEAGKVILAFKPIL